MVIRKNRPPPDDKPCADTKAFSDLFDRTFADLWNFVRRRSDSAADADDLVSEVFSIAWRRRYELPKLDEQRLWLFGVARNALLNQRRSISRRQRLADKLASQPVMASDDTERDDSIWRALGALSEIDRDVLLMRAWDQLSVGEMAVLLECTPNAVSLRLHKAKARLKIELATVEHAQKDFDLSGNEVLEPAKKGGSR